MPIPKHTKHQGSCHCGTVRFEVEAPVDIEVLDCNCSICTKSGFLHMIVPQLAFTILHGEDKLSTYTFNTKTAKHMFCKTCGIKSFYIPRSHPDSYSINVNCLDKNTIRNIATKTFDGQNWENNIAEIQSAGSNSIHKDQS